MHRLRAPQATWVPQQHKPNAPHPTSQPLARPRPAQHLWARGCRPARLSAPRVRLPGRHPCASAPPAPPSPQAGPLCLGSWVPGQALLRVPLAGAQAPPPALFLRLLGYLMTFSWRSLPRSAYTRASGRAGGAPSRTPACGLVYGGLQAV